MSLVSLKKNNNNKRSDKRRKRVGDTEMRHVEFSSTYKIIKNSIMSGRDSEIGGDGI